MEEEEEGEGPNGVEVHTSECASNSCILGRMSILVEFVTDDMTLISITPGCSLSNSNVWECPNALRG